MGYSVAALDCRGQGGKSEDVGGVPGTTLRGHIIRGLESKSPEDLLFRSVFLDCAQLANIMMGMPGVDPARVGATGGSQGGALCLVCAALEPRVKRVFSVFPFLSDYKRVWDMDLCVNAYDDIKYFLRHFDPHHEREEEIFTRLGYIDIHHLTGRIKGEVMMGITLMDNICPPSTQFAAFNNIKSKKTPLIYPDYGHEGLPFINDRIFEFMSGL
jgi:cephalosporin-C deacetylase